MEWKSIVKKDILVTIKVKRNTNKAIFETTNMGTIYS